MPFKISENSCEKCDLCESNNVNNIKSEEYHKNLNESMDCQSNGRFDFEEVPEASILQKRERIQKPKLKTDTERCLLIQVRNARERNRIFEINKAFWRLAQAVPYTSRRTKRISKVKTLKKALQYITELEEQLYNENTNDNGCS